MKSKSKRKSSDKRRSSGKSGKRKVLVVEFDVTDLSKDEIGELELETVVQGEESDGQGGKRYYGETGHPDAAVLGTKAMKRGKHKTLVVEFAVTGFTKSEIGYLASEAEVQGEASDGHPDANATSKVVAR